MRSAPALPQYQNQRLHPPQRELNQCLPQHQSLPLNLHQNQPLRPLLCLQLSPQLVLTQLCAQLYQHSVMRQLLKVSIGNVTHVTCGVLLFGGVCGCVC